MSDALNHLRTLVPEAPPSAVEVPEGLADRVRREAHRRTRKSRRTATGLIALLLGSATVVWQASPPSGSPHAQGARWLVAAQDADGGWSAGTNAQARPDHRVGVTGLALLALLQDEDLTRKEQTGVQRGVDWLLDSQQPDGALVGSGKEQMLAHGMACRALLLAREQGLLSEPQAEATDEAVRFIARSQHPSGGWGYRESPDGFSYQAQGPTTSASVWPLRALALDKQADASYARGIAWLETCKDTGGQLAYRPGARGGNGATLMGLLALKEAGHPLPQTIPEAPTNDLYLSWFRHAASNPSVPAAGVLGRQQADGGWPAEDRWGAAGGRVYTTAMALMLLNG